MGRGGELEDGSLAGEFGGGGRFFCCFSLDFVFVFVLFVLFSFCCWIGFGVFLFLFFRVSSFVCFLVLLFVLVCSCLFCMFVLECFCCFLMFSCCVWGFVFVLFFVFVEVV